MAKKLPSLGELYELHFSVGIRSTAIALISIFIPIYLLSLGFILKDVALFYIITYLTVLVFTPVCMLTASRRGLKIMMLISIPLAILYYLCLYVMVAEMWRLLFVGLIRGLSLTLYWVPMHSLFIRYSKYGKRASAVSIFMSFMKMPRVVCPLIGGVLIYVFSYQLVFVLAIIGLIISVVPLFFTADIRPRIRLSPSRIFDIREWRFSLGFFADGIRHVAYVMLWPIFVFVMLKSTISLGIVGTLTGLATVIFTLIVGWLSDNISARHVLKSGGVLMSVIWLLRISISTYAQFLFISVTDGFFSVLINVPFLSMFYDLASDKSPDEFIIFRELVLNTGKIFFLLLVYLKPGFALGFSLVALTSLIYTIFF